MIGGDDGIPVTLREADYGFLIINDAHSESGAIPRYVVADKKKKDVIVTRDLETFKAELKSLPTGATIHRFDKTCGAPLYYGMEQAFLDSITNYVSAIGLHLEEGDLDSTCTCKGP